jgi:L-amino acid N-acyltransferase YncA
MISLIRLATEADAEQIQAIYGPVVSNTTISFETKPPTMAEMRQRISTVLEHYPWLVYEQQGQVLGYVYAGKHHARLAYQWSVDVSVYIHADARRLGLGRKLYTILFKLLRLQGFYNAYAGIALPNPGSVGLHEALGFTPIGVYREVGYKLGAWRDVGYWHLALQPKAVPPAPLLSLKEAQASKAWAEIMGHESPK